VPHTDVDPLAQSAISPSGSWHVTAVVAPPVAVVPVVVVPVVPVEVVAVVELVASAELESDGAEVSSAVPTGSLSDVVGPELAPVTEVVALAEIPPWPPVEDGTPVPLSSSSPPGTPKLSATFGVAVQVNPTPSASQPKHNP
jgi:hypothetical protein